MSDEEQQRSWVVPAVADVVETSGERWSDPISEERQIELQGYLRRWQAETVHGERKGPFDIGVDAPGRLHELKLTGADVFWLAEQSGRKQLGQVPNLHLEGADLREAHLEGAGLYEAHLEGARLIKAHLERASLIGAHLEGADLYEAHLEGARLIGAHLEGAELRGAHLERARLIEAHFEGAELREAHLEGGDLREAHLEGASLVEAHLEGKIYTPHDPAYLQLREWVADYPASLLPADLRGAVFDAATSLSKITLGDGRHGAVRVADLRWGGANLAVVDWTLLIEPMTELGDERAAREWKPESFRQAGDQLSRAARAVARAKFQEKQARERLEIFRAAVRANRQLATALRDQGMNEEADQFAYRAQVIQREVFLQQGKRGRAQLSWFLDVVAGHGYRPQRSLYTYVGVILGFALLYLLAGHGLLTFGLPASQLHELPWYEALILSVSSFHGRGFFQPLQSPGDPIAIIAAAEAIFGLLIEVSFIATFTQRFFGK